MTNELLRLLAYTGNSAAREALHPDVKMEIKTPFWDASDEQPAEEHIVGLLKHYIAAAPGLACASCKTSPEYKDLVCFQCRKTPGKAPDPHALLKLATKIGWASWLAHTWSSRIAELRTCHALRTVDAWIAEPSDETLAVVEEATIAGLPGFAWHVCMAILHQQKRESHIKSVFRCAVVEGADRKTIARCAVELVSDECDCDGSWLADIECRHGACNHDGSDRVGNCQSCDCQGTRRVPK